VIGNLLQGLLFGQDAITALAESPEIHIIGKAEPLVGPDAYPLTYKPQAYSQSLCSWCRFVSRPPGHNTAKAVASEIIGQWLVPFGNLK